MGYFDMYRLVAIRTSPAAVSSFEVDSFSAGGGGVEDLTYSQLDNSNSTSQLAAAPARVNPGYSGLHARAMSRPTRPNSRADINQALTCVFDRFCCDQRHPLSVAGSLRGMWKLAIRLREIG